MKEELQAGRKILQNGRHQTRPKVTMEFIAVLSGWRWGKQVRPMEPTLAHKGRPGRAQRRKRKSQTIETKEQIHLMS